jgi:hypothetical protein
LSALGKKFSQALGKSYNPNVTAPVDEDITFQVDILGKSMGGLDIPVVVIKKPEAGAVLSPIPKKIIIVCGRVHPSESPSSFMVEGFLRKFMESKGSAYKQLF